MVVSSDADARYALLADQATSELPLVWPTRLRTSASVSGRQILTTRSAAENKNSMVSLCTYLTRVNQRNRAYHTMQVEFHQG